MTQKLEGALRISRDTGCSPSPCPARGSDEPQPNKSPFSPACPARQRCLSGRTLDAGKSRQAGGVCSWAGESQGGWGEPTALQELAGVKNMSPRAGRPCRGKSAVCWAPRAAGGCGARRKSPAPARVLGSTPRCHPGAPTLPAHTPGVQAATPGAAGCRLPALKMGERPFNGQGHIYLFLLLHNQGLKPAQGEGDSLENTDRERHAQTYRYYTCMHTSLSLFFFFFC